MKTVENEYNSKEIFPKKEHIFRALNLVEPLDIKAVILGQDPYHGTGEANGLCFSVDEGVKIPPSLRNIFNELESDTGVIAPHGDLTEWAKEGVLLLNTSLTVQKDKANSHSRIGWNYFTDRVIAEVARLSQSVVFILWGENAKAKKSLITNRHHLILEAPHPSPLSVYRGYFGCKHFSKANDFLIKSGRSPINWSSIT